MRFRVTVTISADGYPDVVGRLAVGVPPDATRLQAMELIQKVVGTNARLTVLESWYPVWKQPNEESTA